MAIGLQIGGGFGNSFGGLQAIKKGNQFYGNQDITNEPSIPATPVPQTQPVWRGANPVIRQGNNSNIINTNISPESIAPPDIGGLSINIDQKIADTVAKKNNIQQGVFSINGPNTPSMLGGIPGINQNIGAIPGISQGVQNTSLMSMLDTTKTAISNEIKPIQTPKIATVNTVDVDTALNDLTADMTNVVSEGRTPDIGKLKELYPEFSDVDDTVLTDLTADIGNVVREGRTVDMDRLKELYPELISTDKSFDELSTYGKLMYIPKTKEEKKSMPLRWKIANLGGKSASIEEQEKLGITKEDRAASAGFIGEFKNIVGNVLSLEGAFSKDLEKQEQSKQRKERGRKGKEEVYKAMGTTEGIGGFNEQAAKFTAQLLPTLLVPEARIAEGGVQLLSKMPYLAKLLENPITRKVIKTTLASELGMESYALAAEGRNMSLLEAGLGAIPGGITALGFAKPLVSKAALKIAQGLETSGIINPAKFAQIQEKLLVMGEKGFEKAGVGDVSQWMLDRGIKGNKEKIVTQLTTRGDKASTVLGDTLKTSTKTYGKGEVPAIENILNNLKNEYDGAMSAAYSAKATKVDEYITKLNKGKLTLKEINEVKQLVWKDLNPYTASGKVKAAQADLSAATSELRGFIEKEAEKTIKGVKASDIRLLNNEISTSYGLAEGIARKEATDFRQELLNFWSARSGGMMMGGVAGSQVGPFDKSTAFGRVGNILIGAFLGKLTSSTAAKTWLANKLNSTFSKAELPVLEKYLQSFSKGGLKPITVKGASTVEKKVQQLVNDAEKQTGKTLSSKTTKNGLTSSTVSTNSRASNNGLTSNGVKAKKATTGLQGKGQATKQGKIAELIKKPPQDAKVAISEVAKIPAKEMDGLYQEYIGAMEKRHPNSKAIIIDSDTVKKIVGNTPKYHELSSALSTKLYEKALREDTSGIVRFTGGGTASGKSEIVVKDIMDKPGIIYDYTLSSIEGFDKRYQMAIKAGKKVELDVVYADPKLARKLNAIRNASGKQTVANSILEKNHEGFRDTILQISKKYPDVSINAYVNRGFGKEFKKIHQTHTKNFIENNLLSSNNVVSPKVKEVSSLIDSLKENSGITYSVKMKKAIAGEPYISVGAYPKRGEIFDVSELNTKKVADFIEKNKDLLSKKGHTLGGWINSADGKVYLDISVIIPKKFESKAVKLGEKYNQISVFDLDTFNEIPTHGTGKPINMSENTVWNDIKPFVN